MSTCDCNIFETGSVINEKWVILDQIGKGAMGEIYLAHQLNLKRDVAIKVVSDAWLRDIDDDPEEVEIALQRFQREVHAMAKVRHSNVLQIFDFGSATVKKRDSDCPVEFIVMEYIPGDTLRFTMSEEGFYPEQDLVRSWLEDYFFPLLNGVKAIHDLDIVHRDLKPENILLDGTVPKIADFGLARSPRLKPVTQSMDVKGTAHYMSPEHFFDFRKADRRADVYSLGKILFEAVTGKIGERTIPFKTAGLPEADTPFFQKLDRIIQDATAEKKEERLESVNQLHKALLEAIDILKKEPVAAVSAKPHRFSFLHNPKWIWTGIVLAIMSVAAMTFWHLTGEPGKTSVILKSQQTPNGSEQQGDRSKSSSIETAPSNTPAKRILAEDGATLHFVPGGKVILPQSADAKTEEWISVHPFYMDETQVTNHQYVEFLNRSLSRIHVERGVVRVDDEIWLLLGDVMEGYNPIVFRKGKFQINNIAFASYPVLRVTAYGATAYATFFDRRLPTYAEWLHVLGNDDSRQVKPSHGADSPGEEQEMPAMHSQMHAPTENDVSASKTTKPKLSLVVNFQPNRYGIRGLNESIKEWGLRVPRALSRDKIKYAEYVILPSTTVRFPWEGFEEVGFRCVREIRLKEEIKK